MSQLETTLNYAENIFNQSLKAIGCVCVGWTCFAIADAVSKVLTEDYPVSQIIFIVNALCLLVILPFTLLKHGTYSLCTHYFKWHITRGVLVALTSFCVVHSFARIPLADFYGIVFLSPMVIAIMSAFFLKEAIGTHRLLAIIAGFIGVIILAGPQFNTLNIGILFAFISVLFVSANAIILRKIGDEKNLLIFAFYPVLFSSLLNAPFMFNAYVPIQSSDSLLYLFLVPLVLIGVLGLALGFRLAPETSIVAPFHYMQIIWGVIFGYFLFSDIPSISTIIGASIIVFAGLFLIIKEKKQKTLKR